MLDDFSRFIIAWKALRDDESAGRHGHTRSGAGGSGFDHMTVVHRPRLLSDNGSSYVASDLLDWLDKQNIEHVRGAPYHPQTQGKIERWHQTLKNRILSTTTLPGDLERQVAAFVAHYNHARYHENSTILPRLTSTSGALRPSSSNVRKDQAPDNRKPSLAASTECRTLNHR